jgi:hypothetical protein
MPSPLDSGTELRRFRPAGRLRHRLEVGRRLCRRHAGSLLAMASLILDDLAAAGDVVVETIVDASRRMQTVDPDDERVGATLAASVYSRCIGVLALHERFGSSPYESTAVDAVAVPIGELGVAHRCAVALTLFGGHDLLSAASILNLSPATVLHQLEDALAIYEHGSESALQPLVFS